MTKSEDSVILDALKKVQSMQPELLKKGYSAHLDASIHNSIGEDGTHLSFVLTIFEGNDIIKSFDFSAYDTPDMIEATTAIAVAFTKSLEANV